MSNYRSANIARFSDMFKALSNPNRVKIFLRLVSCCSPETPSCTDDRMRTCVGELGADLGIAPSTVSHHIKELNRAGLIKMERCGQTVRCRVDPATLKELESFFGQPVGA